MKISLAKIISIFQDKLVLMKIEKRFNWSRGVVINFFSKHFWAKATAFFVLTAIMFVVIFSNQKISAATYIFIQNNWSGGVSEDTAYHPDDQSMWQKFFSKSENLKISEDGGELSLQELVDSFNQEAGVGGQEDFLSGELDQVEVVNSTGGDEASMMKIKKANEVSPMIVAGGSSAYILKDDGTVWAWGDNMYYGLLGDSTTIDRGVPVQVLGPGGQGFLTDVVAIAAGKTSAYAVKSDGTVWSWGRNSFGELGDNTTTSRFTPVQVLGPGGSGFLTDVIAIAAGEINAYALKSDGTVWSWGYNGFGRLGDNTTTHRYAPVQVRGPGGSGFLTDVIAIAAGDSSGYAVKSDGSAWAWGHNGSGRLGINNTTDHPAPIQILGPGGAGYLTDVIAVSGGSFSAYALKSDGTVWSWGRNNFGQLGNTSSDRYTPIQVTGLGGSGFLTDVVKISSGNLSAYALKSDGTVWSWGSNNNGQLGDNTTTQRNSPVQVRGPGGSGFLTDVFTISGGSHSGYAVKSNGTAWAWGNNSNSKLGDNTIIDRHAPIQILDSAYKDIFTNVIATASGESSVYALKNDGTVWAWGNNNSGDLGDNTSRNRDAPIQVLGPGGNGFLTDVIAISAGGGSGYALKSDGTVWAWGSNSHGQLGDNTNTQRMTPVQVRGPDGSGFLTDVIKISGGAVRAYALKSDGTVWAWGSNHNGQLGDNTTTIRYAPVQVLGPGGEGFLTDIIEISGGNSSAYALKSDGTVWAWGNNANGRLGDDTVTDRHAPVQVLGLGGNGFLTDIIAVSGGAVNAYALKSDGTVWAWGFGSGGQIGDSSYTERRTPVQVRGPGGSGFLTDVVEIVGGSHSAYAIKNNGTVWAWGSNANGKLGDNNIIIQNRNAPVQVVSPDGSGFLTGITKISSDASNAHALKTDGTVWAWGSNNHGQLGGGTMPLSAVPISVMISVVSGDYFNAGYDYYYNSGIYTSQIIDLGLRVKNFLILDLDENSPSGTNIALSVRAGNNINTDDDSWTAWTNALVDGADISFLGSKRYLQYRIIFLSTNNQLTPTVTKASFSYSYYPSGEFLMSSVYDTIDSANIIGLVGMNEGNNLPPEVNGSLSIRTAAEAVLLESAQWHEFSRDSDGCEVSEGQFQCPAAALPSALKSGEDDRFWQYKITLNSDGSDTPTITEVEVKYVVNAPPEVRNLSVTQSENNGEVEIVYEVRDKDALSGSNTPSKIAPSFEYYLDGSWIACESLSEGATSLKNVDENDFSQYSLTWNAKNDIPGQFNGNIKVRVKVDDGEPANNIVSLESEIFSLDLTDPIVNSLFIDARSDASSSITLSVSDDNMDGLKIKFSNNIDLSADGSNPESGLWTDYRTSFSWNFAGDSPVVYYQVKDKYQNLAANGAILSGAAPSRPTNIIFQDVSSVATGEWREFIAWGQSPVPTGGFKQYNIYRSEDGNNFYLYEIQEDRLINFILDANLDKDLTYYYKLAVVDQSGNISKYSNVVSDRPDGQGGTDLTPPLITNIQISEISAQSALITWDTDEPSNSVVSYISNDSGNFEDAPTIGINTMTDSDDRLGKHTVFLNHLSPDTTYYIQISSSDPSGNTAAVGEGLTFSTLAGPMISDIEINNIQNTSATIYWTTSVSADSRVFYSKNPNLSNALEAASTEETVNHVVNLTGLQPGTKYYFYIKSNVAEDRNIVNGELRYHGFMTTADNNAPEILFDINTDLLDKTETSIRIKWKTDKLSSATIEYSQDDSYEYSMTSSNLNTDHSFNLVELEKGSSYNFRLKNHDINGNEAVMSELVFATDDYSDLEPPLISGVTIQQIHDKSALIFWQTDEPATSVVEHGEGSESYTATTSNSSYNYKHSVLLENLTIKTKYYFRVSSVDRSDNISFSDEFNFVTQDELVAGATSTTIVIKEGGGVLIVDKSDGVAPVISDVEIDRIGTNRATISWKTNELADSIVEFGKNNSFDLASVDLSYASEHSRSLINLETDTKYSYRISSTDPSGNRSIYETGEFRTLVQEDGDSFDDIIDFDGILDEQDDVFEEVGPEEQAQTDENFLQILRRTFDFLRQASRRVSSSILEASLIEQQEKIKEMAEFTTLPNITSGPTVNVWEDMAIISWETDKKTNSLVVSSEDGVSLSDINLSQVYGRSDVYSNIHQVVLPGLIPGTTYNYQIKGATQIGSTINFTPRTLTTLVKAARVDNYVVDRLDATTASFKWSTSVPANSSITLIPYRNGAISHAEAMTQNSSSFTTLHEMTVKNLEPGVFYRVDMSGKTSNGTVLSQSIQSFSASQGETLFTIEQVKTSSALTGNESMQVQSIISWTTTKPATSKVYYRRGFSNDDSDWPFETTINSDYSRRHLVVITNFTLGEVYQFQVESVDSSGEIARSQTHTILTPRQRESVFQVILKNVEQTFGWVSRIRQ